MNFEFDVKDVKRMINEKVRNQTVSKLEVYYFIEDLYADNTISREAYYDLRNFVRSLNVKQLY